MNNTLPIPLIDLATRQAMLVAFPCFAGLSAAQSAVLTSKMSEMKVQQNARIVQEGELVDSIYIIVQGEAEVSRLMKYRMKMIETPIGILHIGESIGLNDTGFYSDTGKRTATVTAMTDMLLLRLNLQDLSAFLKEYNLETSMYAASSQMLRMQLIKQSLPFAKLSHERLQWLANHVEEITTPANAVIFQQGDRGDKCYLIRAGTIDISTLNKEGETRPIATLKPPMLFGEATLITHTPRNATATAITPCELLMLRQEHLSELLESEDKVANMFMTLTVDRSRPNQVKDVSIHKSTTADGQDITILKHPYNNSYFKLAEDGAFIWQQLNGQHTLREITLELADKFDVFAPDVVAALISKLNKAGFISNLNVSDELKSQAEPVWLKLFNKIRQPLEKRFAFGDADKWLTHVYKKYIHYLYSPTGQIFLAMLAFLGFVSFIWHTKEVFHFFSDKHASLLLLLALLPLSIVAVILHELGHAFTVKAFGREVHYIGVGWYWFGPIAFTDTSDMWLSTRKPRMLVNFAGIYVDILTAGFFSLCLIFITQPYLQGVLWISALYTYISAFRMFSPLQEMDGYYILMDWVEKNRLRQSAVMWLVKEFSLFKPSIHKHSAEVIYWVACIIYLFLATVLTLLVQTFVFSVLGIATNIYVSLILPVIVVLFSSIGIIIDIKNRAEG